MSNIPETGRTPRVQIRLMVIQILVFSLLLTLGGRLWYLQIRNGDEYTVEARNNHVQQVVQPAVRGSILDARGVPLADNETRLVVSADRTKLMSMADDGKAVLSRLAGVLGMRPADVIAKVRLCDAKTSKPCWNGSPYQPIPVTEDATTQQALQIRERPRTSPASPPSPPPYAATPAPAASTPPRYSATLARSPTRRSPSRRRPAIRCSARTRSAGPAWSRTTTRSCAASRASPVTRWTTSGRVIGKAGEQPVAARQHSGHQHRLPGPGDRREGTDGSHEGAAQDLRLGHPQQLQGRLRRRRGDGRAHRADHRDGQRPDLRPQRLGRRHLRQGLRQAHQDLTSNYPLLNRATQGQSAPRLDLQGHLHQCGDQRRLPLLTAATRAPRR